jgi:hypothetical protein
MYKFKYNVIMMKSIDFEKILIFFWICILFSINSSYETSLDLTNIYKFFFSKSSFFTFTNFIRFYIPFVILPILIIIFLFNKSKKIDTLIFLFFFYFSWQLFVFFFSDRQTDLNEIFTGSANANPNIFNNQFENSIFVNLNLIFCSLSVLIIITIAENLRLNKFNKKIFIITLLYIGLIAAYFVHQLIAEAIINDKKFIYFSETLTATGTVFYQPSPRVTGISRSLLIFYFLFFIFLIKSQKKIIWYSILIILILLLYKMQTRGSFVGISLLYILYFLFNSHELKKKIFNLFVLLIVPIVFFETYYFIKHTNPKFQLQYMSPYSDEYLDGTSRLLQNDTSRLLQNDTSRLLQKDTSGRLHIWKTAIFMINEKKIILGYGPQADRFLLNIFAIKNFKKNVYYDKHGNAIAYDNNVSNSLLYAYLCGGVIGIFLLLTIYLIVITVVAKNVFVNKNFAYNNNLWVNFSTVVMIYLGFRGIFENSFSVFGIDYILFILAYLTLKNLAKSPNKIR